jgi:hypothetical protein
MSVKCLSSAAILEYAPKENPRGQLRGYDDQIREDWGKD